MTSPARLALGALVALTVAACQGGGAPAASGGKVAVSVSEAGCSPTTVTAAAGPVMFVITNTGTDVAEFEVIGADKKVIDEAENIVPGFVVNLSTRLDGGHVRAGLRQPERAPRQPRRERRRGADPAAERGRRRGAAGRHRRRRTRPT